MHICRDFVGKNKSNGQNKPFKLILYFFRSSYIKEEKEKGKRMYRCEIRFPISLLLLWYCLKKYMSRSSSLLLK